VRAVQEQCAGDATGRGDPTGSYAGVPTVFLQHTRVRRGSLTREQENPRVRRKVGIANPFGSIVSSQGSMTFSSSYPRGSLNRYHHESPRRLLLRPSSTHCNSRQASSSLTEAHHRRALPITDLVRHRSLLSIRSSPQPRLPQGLP
jgi:hypothetical protein